MTYEGKTIIVTGGGQGIGREIAWAYGKMGGRIAIVDTNQATGKAVVEEMVSEGLKATYLYGDVSKETDVKYMVAETLRIYEGIDVLINNAAISSPSQDPLEMNLDTWNRIIGVNLTGTYLCSKHCSMPMKVQGHGNIINIASTRAFMSEPNTEAYTASKGGVISLTHSMAISLGKYGIRVNAISPGWIQTVDYHLLRTIDHKQHPVGRVGTPEDIASLCLYLTSKEASFITGQNFTVDGGMTKKMMYEE